MDAYGVHTVAVKRPRGHHTRIGRGARVWRRKCKEHADNVLAKVVFELVEHDTFLTLNHFDVDSRKMYHFSVHTYVIQIPLYPPLVLSVFGNGKHVDTNAFIEHPAHTVRYGAME